MDAPRDAIRCLKRVISLICYMDKIACPSNDIENAP